MIKEAQSPMKHLFSENHFKLIKSDKIFTDLLQQLDLSPCWMGDWLLRFQYSDSSYPFRSIFYADPDWFLQIVKIDWSKTFFEGFG